MFSKTTKQSGPCVLCLKPVLPSGSGGGGRRLRQPQALSLWKMPGNPGLLPGVSHIAASCTHARTHTHIHTCQLYKELLAPFPKAKKKKERKKNPSLGYFKKKDFCIFSSLEICKGLENSSLSWGNFMNTLHRSVFYTEASDQT